MDDDDFRLKPGRIRSTDSERNQPAITQIIRAAQRAGGTVSKAGRIARARPSTFGRGRIPSVSAFHNLRARSRGAVIKARVVRHSGRASLSAHLSYIQRDGVSREQHEGRLFGAETDEVDRNRFAERCEQDRHHFRFIVSPDDAEQMADVKRFTRDLMRQMEKDLGTALDWAAADHWNTQHPHIHVILRGVTDTGENLVMSRDYISRGMRARAQDLITRELGLRSEQEIRHRLERQVSAERWTDLDRDLAREQKRHGFIDMTGGDLLQDKELRALHMGRLRKLERLGLADELMPGCWSLREDAQTTLRQIGERGDIIKRMHQALKEQQIDRATERFALETEPGQSILGRLVERGLHDELAGTAYAIIDGIDGRTHHVVFPNIEATGDSANGSIVELRHFEDRRGRARTAMAVRSDLDIRAQITAPGATWLDRQLVASLRTELAGGFGAEVTQAMEQRAGQLVGRGLARQHGQRILFARNLLDTLRRREIDAEAQKLGSEVGLDHKPSKPGDYVSGRIRQCVTLSSGRFAMIEDGLGFQLVPWSPSLDGNIGRHISGVMRGNGHVEWSLGRGRGIGR